jgi:hypothetical protein
MCESTLGGVAPALTAKSRLATCLSHRPACTTEFPNPCHLLRHADRVQSVPEILETTATPNPLTIQPWMRSAANNRVSWSALTEVYRRGQLSGIQIENPEKAWKLLSVQSSTRIGRWLNRTALNVRESGRELYAFVPRFWIVVADSAAEIAGLCRALPLGYRKAGGIRGQICGRGSVGLLRAESIG